MAGGLARERELAIVFHPQLRSGGGAERYAIAMAAALRDLGWRVLIATSPSVTGSWVESHFGVDVAGMEFLPLVEDRLWVQRLPRALRGLVRDVAWARQLRRLRPILFVNAIYRSELAPVGSKSLYVCHFPHVINVRWTPFARAVYMGAISLIRTAISRAKFPQGYDLVCANSDFTARHVMQRWGVTPEVLYPPCPPIPWVGGSKEKRIIAVGRFAAKEPGVPNKNFDVMIDAFRSLEQLHDEGWSLHIVGACDLDGNVVLDELRMRAVGLPIEFHPNVAFDELKDEYGRAALYWHAQGFGEDSKLRPEAQEHFGMTTVEAMSAGCIPIVYDSAGPREVVEPVEGVGRWETIQALRGETVRLASLNEAERERIAEACRTRAKDFTPERFSNRLREVMAGLER